MATFSVYRLYFTAPLHIGSHQDDESQSKKALSSDALYAALTSCLAKSGDDIPADGDLGFTISNLFPYYQREAASCPVYFLPMPLHIWQARLKDVSVAKKVKKVKWVDAALFANILSGHFDMNISLPFVQEAYLTQTELPEDANGSKEFVKSEVSQRVTLESRTGDKDARPYFVDKVLFRHHAGLYFMAEGNTERLDRVLRLLSLEGLGTDRNVGFGFFDYQKDRISIELPQQADHQIALSLLIPESEEQLKALLDSEQVAYDFTRVGGWITTSPYTTLRKNAIYGFLPGSILKCADIGKCSPIGRIVDLQPQVGSLTPDHPIWRCGRSLMLPIII
jgi:CRISPR-associated protein Csm4